ncbi:WW domain-containing protein [Mycena kentingensis (nom. inval.)]|nr:WW domain-containing protein [Mycena kentingensis (nom. inval.)]
MSESSKETPPVPEASSSAEATTTAEDSTADTATTETPPSTSEAPAAVSSTPWQAIYSPQYNTYYFYNTETQETTWTNPLQPAADNAEASGSGSGQPPADGGMIPNMDPRYAAMQNAAMAQGIDPALAYLDPTLAASTSAGAPAGSFQARFNARTGRFTAMDDRTPDHMSEYERMKRMSSVFFDVDAWQNNLQAEKAAEEGKKRKKPSKKDLERYKQQKKLKKIAKTAWLRT